MRLGLFCTYENPQMDYRSAYAEQSELVKLIEALGFDDAWIAEHHFNSNARTPLRSALSPISPRRPRVLAPAIFIAVPGVAGIGPNNHPKG